MEGKNNMSNDCYYFQCSKTVWVTDPVSGRRYISSSFPLEKWEVHGKFLPVSYHGSEKDAEKECERRMKLPDCTPPKGNRTGK